MNILFIYASERYEDVAWKDRFWGYVKEGLQDSDGWDPIVVENDAARAGRSWETADAVILFISTQLINSELSQQIIDKLNTKRTSQRIIPLLTQSVFDNWKALPHGENNNSARLRDIIFDYRTLYILDPDFDEERFGAASQDIVQYLGSITGKTERAKEEIAKVDEEVHDGDFVGSTPDEAEPDLLDDSVDFSGSFDEEDSEEPEEYTTRGGSRGTSGTRGGSTTRGGSRGSSGTRGDSGTPRGSGTSGGLSKKKGSSKKTSSRGMAEPSPGDASDQVVNTGFASHMMPEIPIESDIRLVCGGSYYFWFQIDKPVTGAIDVEPAQFDELAKKLPREAQLTIALFGYDGEIALSPGEDIGAVKIQPGGTVQVVQRVAEPDTLGDGALLDKRLFFPVKMPEQPGLARLRCNLYYNQVLVQSHLVQADVYDPAVPSSSLQDPALQTQVDYTLSKSLRPEHLEGMAPHRMSIMLNGDDEGTHNLRFYGHDGQDTYKEEVSIDAHAIQNLIDRARDAFRIVTWGSPEAFNYRQHKYLYDGGYNEDNLKRGLVLLAREGARLYAAVNKDLVKGKTPREIRNERKRLKSLMLKPGFVQLASRESSRHLLPASIMYDYTFDETLHEEKISICPSFLDAVQTEGIPLWESPCFQGACTTRDQLDVVCPSGFWGYRHMIGFPVSIGGDLDHVVLEIPFTKAPSFTVAVYTGQDFRERDEHIASLKRLQAGLGWNYAESKADTLAFMQSASSHIVYFYCHGGIDDGGMPFLRVGSENERGLTGANLENYDIFWEETSPLVFINGCHTAALEPESAMNLVDSFVYANAAGIIGTEITIFEPLAVAFAEACFRYFLDEVPIGEAIRRARLELLKQGNPLGLVYIPYVMANLVLKEAGL